MNSKVIKGQKCHFKLSFNAENVKRLFNEKERTGEGKREIYREGYSTLYVSISLLFSLTLSLSPSVSLFPSLSSRSLFYSPSPSFFFSLALSLSFCLSLTCLPFPSHSISLLLLLSKQGRKRP